MRKIRQVPKGIVESARRDLQQFLMNEHISGLAFARQCGVTQSVVWRFLNGETQKITPKVQRILNYAQIDLDNRIGLQTSDDPLDNSRLRQVVGDVCRDRPSATELLVKVIAALGPVIQEVTQQRRGGL
jgi:transcriptional regulator with XRE-family HTH domain